MSFKLEIGELPEGCDKCQRPGTVERPMVMVTAHSRENGTEHVLEKAIALAKRKMNLENLKK